MITGATAGIGAAFSRHLAASGHHLILVARDAARLAQVRQSLLAFGAPDVEVLTADLTLADQRAAVAARLVAGDVDLLVNNAGIGLGKSFQTASETEVLAQLDINVTAPTMLCHAAVPPMVARGHGGIINVASIAGLIPGRGTTYAASKAYVISLSEGLANALADTGVRVQALCPGFVRTEFHQRAGIDMNSTPSWSYVDVDRLVVTSLADLRTNRVVSVPSPLYGSIAVGARLLPRRVVRRLAARIDDGRRT